jgi:hypothetical protein
MLINNAVITGSFIVNGVSVTGITGSSELSSSYLALSSSYLVTSGSYAITSASYAQSSASLSIRTGNLEATSSTLVSASSSFAASSASVSVRVTNLEATSSVVSSSFAATSGSLSTRVTNLEVTSSVVSSSFATTSGSISGRVTLIEGQYATTGSNVFTGPQYVNQASNAISFTSTASLYTDGGLRVAKDSFVSGTAYFNNVVVYGTSSIQYITSSQVNFGTNIITVNTDTPAVRFGGLSVFDSGSTGLTGSILWDSEKNHWIYSNPSGSTYNSAMLMNGPRNTGSLGDEQGTTSCALMVGQGGDHITSSAITHYSTATCFYGQSYIGSTGTACFAGSITGSSATFSSTISGTTIYGSTAVCSPVGKFTTCIDAGSGTFSGVLTVVNSSGVPVSVTSTAATSTFVLDNTNANLWGGVYAVRVNGVDKNYFGTLGSLLGTSNTDATIWATAGNGFRVYTNGNNLRLNIDSAGAATFACSLALGNQEDIVSTIGLKLGYDQSSIEMIASSYANGYGAKIEQLDPSDGSTYTVLYGRANTTCWTQNFKVNNSNGAATFSSTITGTTIYGSTAVCSPIGKFTTCLDLGGALTGTTATFSGNGAFSGVLQVAPTTGTGIIGVGDNFGGNMNAGIYRGGLGVTTSGNYLNIGGYDGVVITTGAAALGSQTVRLTIASTGVATLNASDATYILYQYLGTAKAFIGVAGASTDIVSGAAAGDTVIRAQQKMLFSTGGDTPRLTIASTGNVGIGVTPKVWYTTDYNIKALQIGSAGALFNLDVTSSNLRLYLSNNSYLEPTSAAQTYIVTGAASQFSQENGAFFFRQAASGTAGCAISFTQAMTLDCVGKLGICTTAPSTRLALNSYVGARLPYVNGTTNTYDANGITVGNLNNGNTNIGGGLDMTNNCYCIGAYSPILSFSSVSSNYTYNNSYAGIWGVFQGAGGDANWNKGDLAFGTAVDYGIIERMRIRNSGEVGIGTCSPLGKLSILVDGAAAWSQYIQTPNGGYKRNSIGFFDCAGINIAAILTDINASNSADIGISVPNGCPRLIIKANGDVGVGTGDTGGAICRRFEVYCATSGQSSNAIMRLTSGTNGAYGGETNFEFAFRDFGNSGAYNVAAKIRSGYYEATGTDVAGSLEFYTKAAGGNESCLPVLRMTISCGGNIGAPSGTNIYNASDSRLKRNVSTITCGINKVMALNPVKFNWIEGFESSEEDKDMLGFVAQEVQNIIPEAVENFGLSDIYTSQGLVENPLRVNEKFIIPVLVKAIQEQQCTINLLKSCIGIS